MRKFISLVALSFIFIAAQAQTASSKIGFADVFYILSQLPKYKQVETDLKSTETMLKNQLQAKAQDYQKKLADYNANINNMLDAVRQNTERELMQMQDNLTKLQQDAQTTIQNKEAQLMEPLYKEVGTAIESVAKENGYTFILSQQVGGLDVILYGEESNNISDLVLKKLGVTPKPQAAATPGTTPKQ